MASGDLQKYENKMFQICFPFFTFGEKPRVYGEAHIPIWQLSTLDDVIFPGTLKLVESHLKSTGSLNNASRAEACRD
jgi:hypothetical protein